jgi:hypothetical protein
MSQSPLESRLVFLWAFEKSTSIASEKELNGVLGVGSPRRKSGWVDDEDCLDSERLVKEIGP